MTFSTTTNIFSVNIEAKSHFTPNCTKLFIAMAAAWPWSVTFKTGQNSRRRRKKRRWGKSRRRKRRRKKGGEGERVEPDEDILLQHCLLSLAPWYHYNHILHITFNTIILYLSHLCPEIAFSPFNNYHHVGMYNCTSLRIDDSNSDPKFASNNITGHKPQQDFLYNIAI